MKLNAHFSAFHSQISLDETRVKKIKSAHGALRDFMESDEEIKKFFKDTFLQGSYATDMAIRPKDDEEFDVDVVLALDVRKKFGRLPGASEVIDWILARIKTSKTYKDKAKPRARCIRINYADKFHTDILPAHCPGDKDGALQVPDKWEWSHPLGFIDWCQSINEVSEKKFTRITKILKWWRNFKLGQDSGLKSIVLTTIIGQKIQKECGTDADALVGTMTNISSWLSSLTSVPEVSNPSLPSGKENLVRVWSQSEFDNFKKAFLDATETADEALAEEDKEKSIKLWTELFGDKFPKSIEEEAKAMREAIRKGEAVISSGFLSSSKGSDVKAIPVSPVKQYGA
jgi:hypothetical protein